MAAVKPARLDRTRQIFVHDAVLDETTGVRRRLHAMSKHPANPLVRPDRAWEGSGVHLYGSVWREPDDGQLRMWYRAGSHEPGDPLNRTLVCLATSNDGIHWTKPSLRLHDYWGQVENNICCRPHYRDENCLGRFDSVSLLQDPQEPDPLRRYKMMTFQYAVPRKWRADDALPSGCYVAFSPDGLHWQEHGDCVLPFMDCVGDTVTVMQDTRRKRYIAFVKILTHKYGVYPRRREGSGGGYELWNGKQWIVPTGENPMTRMRGVSVSKDFELVQAQVHSAQGRRRSGRRAVLQQHGVRV